MQLQTPKRDFNLSLLKSLPPEQQAEILSAFSNEEALQLLYDWEFMARPNQLPPPGDWRIWLILAGRGFGKTRSVTEWARIMAQKMPGSRGAIVAATAADARDTVIEGDSGLLNISPPWERPHYSPTKRRVTWKNSSIASLFSADEPERLRGPQFHWAVCDELCLSEETLIDTEYGQRRIDEVQAGDRVWTRQGLRTIVHAWCSHESAKVYEVTMSNGQTLVGTENHPVFVQNVGFIPLCLLVSGDILLSRVYREGKSCQKPRKALSGMEDDTGSMVCTTWIDKEECCIERSIRNITEKSQRNTTSIISMAIKQTMPSKISKHFRDRNILNDIAKKVGNRPSNLFRKSRNGRKTENHIPENAIGAKLSIRRQERAADFAQPIASRNLGAEILQNVNLHSANIVENRYCNTRMVSNSVRIHVRRHTISVNPSKRVLFVDLFSKQKVRKRFAAQKNAATFTEVSVITIKKLQDRRPVFNLEVEGEHEYFANGVLTHNCAWRYPIAWDMLQFGLRLGHNPQVVIATTPKPVSHLKMLVKEAENPNSKIIITRGDTYDNADNLAPTFLEKMQAKYEGTRLGEQELHAVLHEDAAGSLWKSWMFEWEYFRYIEHPIYKRVVVAIDPAIKSGGNGQREETLDEKVTETGIIVAGVDNRNHGYIIEDATISGSPRDWAQEAIYMYKKHKADRIVAEINNGGNMIENTLRTIDSNISFRAVSASRSKQTRAEPVVALYEQKRIHHRGVFADLETQMVQWEPGAKSPDRMDAAVWALTDLLIDAENDEVPMRQGRWR